MRRDKLCLIIFETVSHVCANGGEGFGQNPRATGLSVVPCLVSTLTRYATRQAFNVALGIRS